MSPRRILFISNNQTFGGSEVLWLNLARLLLDKNFQLAFFIYRWDNGIGKFQDVFSHKNVQIFYRSKPGFLRSVISGYKAMLFGEHIPWKSFRPHFAFISLGSHMKTLNQPGVCAKLGIPYSIIFQLVTERTMEGNKAYHEEIRGAIHCYFASLQNKNLLERQLAASVDNGKVIYNSYQISRALAFQWPAEQDKIQMALVCRLDVYHKGLDILMEVLSTRKWKERNIQVNIYGSGSSKVYLEKLISFYDINNVSFSGFSANIEDIWKSNVVFLQPSRQEGMSLALIEAMMCGRVCVTTNVGGAAELIEPGVSGFIAEAPVVRCLDEAMEQAWQQRDHWKSIGYTAYQRVRNVIEKQPETIIYHDLVAYLNEK